MRMKFYNISSERKIIIAIYTLRKHFFSIFLGFTLDNSQEKDKKLSENCHRVSKDFRGQTYLLEFLQ